MIRSDQSSLRTLIFLIKRDRVLLGRKKRGFGAGKWNGFGGKLQAGETLEGAARREFFEETGAQIGPLERRGQLAFMFANLPPLLVQVFVAHSWMGDIQESEEMAPRWFSVAALPYDEMWVDDSHWLPLLLAGEALVGRFQLADTETLETFEVKTVAPEALPRYV